MAKKPKILKWETIPLSEAQYMAKESILQGKFTAKEVVSLIRIADPWLRPRLNAKGEVEVLIR